MQIRVQYRTDDGSVNLESHTMPYFVGSVVSSHDKSTDSDTTSSESDYVTEVSEHLTISERDGVWLSRTIEHERGDARKPAPYGWRDSTRTVCLVSQRKMPEVLRISCNGEVIWPEEQAGIEGEIDRLEQMIEQLH